MSELIVFAREFGKAAREQARANAELGRTCELAELDATALDSVFERAQRSTSARALGVPVALALALSVDVPVTASLAVEPSVDDRELARRLERDSSGTISLARATLEHDRRPWGEYWVIVDDATYKLKRIDVAPRQRLSYQKHARRAEHWIVVRGLARVTLDGRTIDLRAGETIDIPTGSAHRMHNRGETPLTFIELQTGSYFGEDDIQRLDDDFGRAPGQ